MLKLSGASRPNNHVALQDNVAAWKTMREMQWAHGDAMAVQEVPRGHHELASVDQVRALFGLLWINSHLNALSLDFLASGAGPGDADERHDRT